MSKLEMKIGDVIADLRHRAWQERAVASIGRTSKQRTAEAEHAAKALENCANDLERWANEERPRYSYDLNGDTLPESLRVHTPYKL